MLWSKFDEEIYQKMRSDYERDGDKTVNFHGVVGSLSALIEATKMVRSMAGYND